MKFSNVSPLGALKNHDIIYLESSINYGLSLGNTVIFVVKLSIHYN